MKSSFKHTNKEYIKKMELTPKQQIVELIKKHQNILVLTHINPDGDALGSLLAFYLLLKKLDKNVSAVATSEIPVKFNFLPAISNINSEFNGIRDFIINLDLSSAKLDKLSYQKITDENRLDIIITPKTGTFTPEDVSFSYGAHKFDLIFVLDTPDLERLGKVYDENADLFYETPTVNIDHHPSNEYFGKINWVDLTATSTAEILVALIESLSREKQLLDADVATALLTGITTDTGSFQNTNTTPKSLTVAAQLVAAGARQQEIIQKIFKTRELSTLKLWGVILSKVVLEEEGFVWSYATQNDIVQASAANDETQQVVDELLKTVPNTDFALLLTEKSDSVFGSLRSAKNNVDVLAIAKIFGGGGHEQAAGFQIKNTTLNEIKEEILAKIKTEYYKKDNKTLIEEEQILDIPEK